MTLKTIAMIETKEKVCPVLKETFSLSPFPLYCAIRIEPAMVKPIANEIKKKSIGKLNETAATASVPNLPTQKVSIN